MCFGINSSRFAKRLKRAKKLEWFSDCLRSEHLLYCNQQPQATSQQNMAFVAQLYKIGAIPTKYGLCWMTKSSHPLLLAQFCMYGQSLHKWAPTLELASLMECTLVEFEKHSHKCCHIWGKKPCVVYFTEGHYKAATAVPCMMLFKPWLQSSWWLPWLYCLSNI